MKNIQDEMNKLSKYIGYEYRRRVSSKRELLYKVSDFNVTINKKGEITKTSFVAYTLYFGQRVFDYDVPINTVIRGSEKTK